MLPVQRLFFIAAIVQIACVAAGDPPWRAPAQRVVPLKPQNTGGLLPVTQSQSRRETTIPGLLARQSCPTGYGLCGNGRCCKAGSDCCKVGCCDPGNWCYASGCCKRSENGCDNRGCCAFGDKCCSGGGCCSSGDYCAVVDGVKGCCPNGKVCTGSSGLCDKSGYVPCANDDFCCLPGDTCYRDSNNSPGCRAGGGGSPPTTKPTTTHTTTTPPPTTTHTTTPITTTPIPSATNSPIAVPSSVPAPPSGSKNVVIDVSSSTEITWTGDWVLVPSTCTPGNKAKRVSGNSTSFASGIMGYFFAGSSVYLSVVSTNAQYTVSIDNVDTDYGSSGSSPTVAPINCTFGWSRNNLTGVGQHYLSIEIFGASDAGTLHSGKRDILAPWSLEVQNFVITQPSSTTGGGVGSGAASSTARSGGGSGSLGSGAFANHIPWFSLFSFTIFAVFLLYL
ncbi:hypothetical protein C8R47DRAFT_1155007 [Mycena vitilis]|nr:hypothetical protein C8R47DRAFT_1155007 [Mycena vitilis]